MHAGGEGSDAMGEQKCQQCIHLGLDCRYPCSDPSSRSWNLTSTLHLSRRLQVLLTNIPCDVFEVHGAGILQIIYDILTCSGFITVY